MYNMNYEEGNFYWGKDEEENNIPIKLSEFLENNYLNIFEEMKNSEYKYCISGEYAFFAEIKVDNKIIGFSVWDYSQNDYYILEMVYILERYRGNNLFFEHLCDIKNIFKKCISIDCPNWFVVKSLLNNKIAMELDKNVIFSSIPFSFGGAIPEKMEVPKNAKDIKFQSNFYDKHLHRVFTFGENDKLILSPLVDIDFNIETMSNFIDIDEKYAGNLKEVVLNFLETNNPFSDN